MLRAKLPSVRSASVRDTENFGAALAKRAYPGLLVLLRGDLGVGKTQLASAIGRTLGVNNVKSPTFAIESVHRVPGEVFFFVHADLYRLNTAESTVMQLEEYLDEGHVVLVEWADKWEKPPFEDRWDISILHTADESRIFRFSACGERAIASISEAYVEILEMEEARRECR